MPRKTLPRIAAVKAGKRFPDLIVDWQDGNHTRIDLSDTLNRFKYYEPLRSSPDLFSTVRLGDLGTDIVWEGDIDMSADLLRRLADEQSGLTMSPEAFRAWRERNAFTLESAAKTLGLSRRMVAYYEQGEKPIPRVVALATKALEML